MSHVETGVWVRYLASKTHPRDGNNNGFGEFEKASGDNRWASKISQSIKSKQKRTRVSKINRIIHLPIIMMMKMIKMALHMAEV